MLSELSRVVHYQLVTWRIKRPFTQNIKIYIFVNIQMMLSVGYHAKIYNIIYTSFYNLLTETHDV